MKLPFYVTCLKVSKFDYLYTNTILNYGAVLKILITDNLHNRKCGRPKQTFQRKASPALLEFILLLMSLFSIRLQNALSWLFLIPRLSCRCIYLIWNTVISGVTEYVNLSYILILMLMFIYFLLQL